jgi:hypothetical protein
MNKSNIKEAIPNTSSKSLKIGLPKFNTFFTIDPYTSVTQYNEAIQALQNNNIEYTEFISTLGNYNWYLSLDKNQRPIMMNYDKMDRTNWIKTVSKVKPLTSNDIYLLYRRGEKKDIARYIENDWLKIAKKSKGVIFSTKNKEELLMLSKTYGIIYPLGVYFNGSIKLSICFDRNIKNALTPNRILLEFSEHKTGDLELKINNKIY